MGLKDILKFAIKNRHMLGGQGRRHSKTGFQGVYRGNDDRRHNPFQGAPLNLGAMVPGPLGFIMRHWGKLLIVLILFGIALLALGIWLFFIFAGLFLEALGGFINLFIPPEAAHSIPASPHLPSPNFTTEGPVKL